MQTTPRPKSQRPSRRQGVRAEFRRRTLGPISVVPTLLTLANLMCGFAAIHYASRGDVTTAVFGWNAITVGGCLIFLGMFFDAIDGSVARLTRSTSDLGAQLDSIADVVTFGVAPAFLMLQLVEAYYGSGADADATVVGPGVASVYGKAVWAIAALFVCGGALRLARFNAETVSHDEADHRFFKGLPIPGAAGAVASLIVLHQHLLYTRFDATESLAFDRIAALTIPVIALLCGLGMVSNLRYPHVVNRYLRGARDFGSLVRIALPLVAAVWFLQETLAAACTLYALSGPLGLLRRRTDGEAEPADTMPPDDFEMDAAAEEPK